ncbi:dTDP-4-dehydrorhamnose 3,5-epimerase family protein [Candidatus Pelagibacter sp.]|nr:dTDP-4-dehydrorhamnose 3,5-epimerase family protein [Candidatus Pelagibacter sp.]
MNNLKITKLKLKDTFLVESNLISDNRGNFGRYFCKKELKDVLKNKEILNINYSKSYKKGTFRGLHYQKPPFMECKMPRCISGKILDIFVDIRKNSKTFLKWDSVVLSEKNKKMLIIPEGFAHGFQSLEDNSQILYLNTQYFSVKHENGLNIRDPFLKFSLPIPISHISKKDTQYNFINLDKFKGLEF